MRGFLKKVKSVKTRRKSKDEGIDWSMPDDDEDLTKVKEKLEAKEEGDDDSDESVEVVETPASPAYSTIRVLQKETLRPGQVKFRAGDKEYDSEPRKSFDDTLHFSGNPGIISATTTSSRSDAPVKNVISEDKEESPGPDEDQLWVSERAEKPEDLGLDEKSLGPVVKVTQVVKGQQKARGSVKDTSDPPTWPPSQMSDKSLVLMDPLPQSAPMKSRESWEAGREPRFANDGSERPSNLTHYTTQSQMTYKESERGDYQTIVERASYLTLGTDGSGGSGISKTVIERKVSPDEDTLHALPCLPGAGSPPEDPPTGLEAHPMKIRHPPPPSGAPILPPRPGSFDPYRQSTERSDMSEMTLAPLPPARPPPASISDEPPTPSELPKNSISQLNLARIETDRSDAPVSLESPAERGPNQVKTLARIMSMDSDDALPELDTRKSASMIIRGSSKKSLKKSEDSIRKDSSFK